MNLFLESESDLFQIDIDTNDKLKNIKNKVLYYPSEQTWYLNNKLDEGFVPGILMIFIKYILRKLDEYKNISKWGRYLLKMFKPSYTVYDIKLRIFDIIKLYHQI